MSETADVVIVGAGIVGLNAAWQLARRSDLKIVVLDRGAGPGEGSTGASSAVCRHLYTYDETMQLAAEGIDAYRHWADYLETDDRQTRARLRQVGVLWLGSKGVSWGDSEIKRLAKFNVASSLMSDGELQEKFPAINVCGIAPDLATGEEHDCSGGYTHMFEASGGWVDPQAALEDLLTALRARGVEIRFSSQVQNLEIEGGRIAGVSYARKGSAANISTRTLVSATGPWSKAVIELAGLYNPWPMIPTRIQILHLDWPTEIQRPLPVCVDLAAGIYFRGENNDQQIIVGSTLESDEREMVEDPDDFDRLEDESFRIAKLHALHHRLPAMPYRGRVGGYCGLYTINRSDMHPVVGRTPLQGFLVANGLSGHGFKLAPAIGALLAQEIAGDCGRFDTRVPASFLAWDRAPLLRAQKNVLA